MSVVTNDHAQEADIRALLLECVEDLAAELEARYPAAIRETYPSIQRDYDRDMNVVVRARAALARTTTPPENAAFACEPPDASVQAQGRAACGLGLPQTANPYPVGSLDFMLWNDGWEAVDEERGSTA